MERALASVGFLAAFALWWWLVVIARPWLTNRADWWIWRKLKGTGPPPSYDEPIGGDFERVLGDVQEALATDREPEDVQRERHARELLAARRRHNLT